MAKSPGKSARAANDESYRKRGNPLTDYLDASEPLERGGFGEAPQPSLKGVPYSGSVSDWARDLERAAEEEGRKSEMRAIRSQAGKHRVRAERGAAEGGPAQNSRTSKKVPERSAAPTKVFRASSVYPVLPPSMPG